MCGIWGYVGNGASIRTADAWDGLCSLTNRGPDDWGLYLASQGKLTDEADIPAGDCTTVLGNRRLSILDLSEAGNQPMGSDDEGWIVYNGEVYNYQELREDLKDRGYEFVSDSDTEVVLHAYQEFGEECVEHFKGMFAFAIYEPGKNQLFAARDRFGIKPFYYDHSDNRFAFASEITALLESNVSDTELNHQSVDGFLQFGYVPSPQTIVKGVHSLPPGSTLYYDGDNNTCKIQSYWTPSFTEGRSATPKQVRKLLSESINLRLRSDVPVGAFLSGGLDSSTIVALMQQISASNYDIHTFSIGFNHEKFSETKFAETVAEAVDTEHTSRTVTATDVRNEIGNIIASMDQPSVDGVNTYFVSKVASESNIKVALTGLGSDELFFGYPSFNRVPRWYHAARVLYTLPPTIRSPIAAVLNQLDAVIPGRKTGKLVDAIRSDSPFGASYVTERGLFTSDQRRDLLDRNPVDWANRIERNIETTLENSSVDAAVSRTELTWYMQNQLLRDTDAMSMAHSLEVRVPFLDNDLAEYLMDSSAESKRVGNKNLLKRAINDLVPLEIIEREKTGFTFPFADWLKDELRDVVDQAFSHENLAQTPLNPEACERIREAFDHDEIHWSRLWTLVVLSLWINEHLSSE